MTTFSELFNTILTADKNASRSAAREVRKFLYSSRSRDAGLREIGRIITNAPKEYENISEDWRQENFVMSVAVIYFLHNHKKEPDFLFPWILKLLQHSNGNIRYAAVRMIDHETGSLTFHVRFPRERRLVGELNPEHADKILFSLYKSLNDLSSALWKPSYKKYKYIDSLPSSPYKSIQMALADLEYDCGDEYINHLNGIERAFLGIESQSAQLILMRRKEIEESIEHKLKEIHSDFTLQDVKDTIHKEQGSRDLPNIISMFDTGKDGTDLNEILQIINDAWNYFPHKSLGGVSPKDVGAISLKTE